VVQLSGYPTLALLAALATLPLAALIAGRTSSSRSRAPAAR
jgi:hypothetical protein